MKSITRFIGDYDFLSNFFPCIVDYEGIPWCTAEHAYQAAKTLSRTEKIKVYGCLKPGEAKRMGRQITIRHDWDQVKLQVMEEILTIKFSIPTLGQFLVQTGDAHLEEGNHWGDTFWGTCEGVGENHLGLILMRIRDRLRLDNLATPK